MGAGPIAVLAATGLFGTAGAVAGGAFSTPGGPGLPPVPGEPTPEEDAFEQERRRRGRRGPGRSQSILVGDTLGEPQVATRSLLGGTPSASNVP